MRVCVVVPARDEEDRIAGCLDALAGQHPAVDAPLDVVVVLDGCRDATGPAVASAAHRLRRALRVHTIEGPGVGSGPARSIGMRRARTLLGTAGGLLLSTDADTRVAPDWVHMQRAAIRGGAHAVGGRILLDPVEAAALAPEVVAARDAAAVGRLERVRAFAPDAEHHQFSGASLALTTDAYDRVGGLPDVTDARGRGPGGRTARRRGSDPLPRCCARDDVRTAGRTGAQRPGRCARGVERALS